jgi:hypothetical protein
VFLYSNTDIRSVALVAVGGAIGWLGQGWAGVSGRGAQLGPAGGVRRRDAARAAEIKRGRRRWLWIRGCGEDM